MFVAEGHREIYRSVLGSALRDKKMLSNSSADKGGVKDEDGSRGAAVILTAPSGPVSDGGSGLVHSSKRARAMFSSSQPSVTAEPILDVASSKSAQGFSSSSNNSSSNNSKPALVRMT